ncbi:unnamed protein product, partial [Adineta ricciae]
MAKIISLFIIVLVLQVTRADLDSIFKSFLASVASTGLSTKTDDAVKSLYTLYKTEFGRISLLPGENDLRLASFKNTLSAIIENYRQTDATYTLGLTSLADWTIDELNVLRSGINLPQGVINSTNAKPSDILLTWDGKTLSKRSTLPTSYDFTQRVVSGTNIPVVLPIRNQGSCGSCYAFAFISLLEFQYAVQFKSNSDLSEQQIVDCSTRDSGCNGGYFTNSFSYLQTNLWQEKSESVYPYKARASKCAFSSAGAGARFPTLVYKSVAANNAAAMQQALVSYGPLWVSLFVGNQATQAYKTISTNFNAYQKGVFQPTGCPTSLSSTNHAVVIVGYGVDATTNLPYWKVRNSWGTNWGESGYFKIRRGVN